MPLSYVWTVECAYCDKETEVTGGPRGHPTGFGDCPERPSFAGHNYKSVDMEVRAYNEAD